MPIFALMEMVLATTAFQSLKISFTKAFNLGCSVAYARANKFALAHTLAEFHATKWGESEMKIQSARNRVRSVFTNHYL